METVYSYQTDQKVQGKNFWQNIDTHSQYLAEFNKSAAGLLKEIFYQFWVGYFTNPNFERR